LHRKHESAIAPSTPKANITVSGQIRIAGLFVCTRGNAAAIKKAVSMEIVQ
jgi:hypothetical protein